MNKNAVSFGPQYLGCARTLFLACLLPTAVFAGTPQVTQQYDRTVGTTTVAASLDPGINGVAAVSTDTHVDDAVIFQHEKIQPMPLISVAFVASNSDLRIRQGSGATDSAQSAASSRITTSEQRDTSRIPYSLVLALFALIGLVPVSRRNR